MNESTEISEQEKYSGYDFFVKRNEKPIIQFWIISIVAFLVVNVILGSVFDVSSILFSCVYTSLSMSVFVIYLLRNFDFQDPSEWKGLFYRYIAVMGIVIGTLLGYVVYLLT